MAKNSDAQPDQKKIEKILKAAETLEKRLKECAKELSVVKGDVKQLDQESK